MTTGESAPAGAVSRGAVAPTQLRLFAGAVWTIAGIVVASLLAVVVPVWLGSALAFLAVAAAVVRVANLPAALDPPVVYAVYAILGLASGTLVAVALAVERSVPRLQGYLDAVAARLLQALVADVGRERSVDPGELAARLQPAIRELARRTAGLRRFTPGGALLRFLVRRLAPEVETLTAVSSSLAVQPGGVTLEAIGTHAAAAAGAQLSGHARRGRVLAVVLWVVVLALAATPLFVSLGAAPR